MVAIRPVAGVQNVIFTEDIPQGVKPVFGRRLDRPAASIRAASTSESLTKTFLFCARCRSSDQYSSRAAASAGTRAVGRWSITILNSGRWSATPAMARMRPEIGICAIEHQAVLGQHLQPGKKFGFLRIDGQVPIPQIAVPYAQKERIRVQPFQVLLIGGCSRNQVANHAHDDGMVGRHVAAPSRYRWPGGWLRSRWRRPLPAGGRCGHNARAGQVCRPLCPSSPARGRPRTPWIEKMNVGVDHGYARGKGLGDSAGCPASGDRSPEPEKFAPLHGDLPLSRCQLQPRHSNRRNALKCVLCLEELCEAFPELHPWPQRSLRTTANGGSHAGPRLPQAESA